MRIRSSSGQLGLLGYCANVHPGESLQAVMHAVSHFAAGVRSELASDELALGLWLSRAALSELEQSGISQLRAALASAGIAVGSLNGFPYGNFHADVVKRAVYHPDLGSPARSEYLLGLARVLAELMPADLAEGTISTLPIGHRAEPLDAEDHTGFTQAERAAQQLCRLCEELARLRDRSGRSIRICLEPEPGCWLETTQDAIAFFTRDLPRVAQRLGVASALLDQHLGLCYDTCHQAVCFEDARASIAALQAAGVRIGKAQLSSAIEIANPNDPELRAELQRFAEPRFLHQVRTLRADGSLACADDLPSADALPREHAWRVHFHVPIHRALLGRVSTTRPFLAEALPALCALPQLPHLEVETYTWSVLPESERPRSDRDLMRGLAAELRWAQGVIA
jgi:sugar phosphate isomerase/epimerase